MKKIFTLFLFAGFLTTAAFAQDGGRHWQNNGQYNTGRNSSYGDRGDHDGYDNGRQWRNRDGDRYREHRDRDRWDRDRRGGWDRDGDWRFHRHYRHHEHYREMTGYPYGYIIPGASFQIIIGHHARR